MGITRYARAFVVLGLALVAACAPLREIGGAFHLTAPGSLAPNSPLARAARDPGQCQAILRDQGVAFTPVRDQSDGRFCDVRDALLLGPLPEKMAPPRPMMTCPLAAAFLLWTRYSVEPAARDMLHTELRQVDHFGVYSCRRVNCQSEGRPSAHARAEAIDVAGFRFADGRQIHVLADWSHPGLNSQFLHLEIGGSGPCG